MVLGSNCELHMRLLEIERELAKPDRLTRILLGGRMQAVFEQEQAAIVAELERRKKE